ncbi:hypothetical protein [Paracoccus shanxieyensis]|uniref:hypothetical protein n=1 Tax=Paracoccus shanxieyensis TaxID=2675752 RepID=UPI001E294250|nr:hypothetical protein [Paracoccus shanxieyensis]
MLPKKGSKLPTWPGFLGDREVLALTVADLLKKEHGDSHRAIKELMRQTGASERTVKHWLSGQHAPEVMFFLRLVVSSPVVRAFVLGIIEGPASEQTSPANDRVIRFATREAYATCHCTLINQILRLRSILGRFYTLNYNTSTGNTLQCSMPLERFQIASARARSA